MASFSSTFSMRRVARVRVRRGEQDLGDFSLEELTAAIEAGQLRAVDEMLADGSNKWVPVSATVAATVTKTARAAEVLNRVLAPTPILRTAPAAQLGCLGSGVLGLAGLVSGGGLLAIILVVAFVWGTLDGNRSGAQEQQIDALRDKIVAYVDAHPEFSAATQPEMEQCPALDDADRTLVRSLKLVLHPVGAGSSPESAVITRPRADGQRMYYKNGNNDFVIRWGAPGGGDVAVESAPAPPPATGRRVRLLRDGHTIVEYGSDALSITTVWRGDGSFVAVNERGRDGSRPVVIAVEGNRAEVASVPESITPAALFDPQDVQGQGLEARWSSDEVTAQRWLPSGDLEVESFGNITLIDADRLPIRYVTVRQRFRLSASAGGAMEIVDSDPPQFHRSVPGAPVRPLRPLPSEPVE